ncbi:MAG: adenosine deaminase [Gemmatimonadota bacterium]|nr:adenosine deaminase [Gemmatimonadota bacterium]
MPKAELHCHLDGSLRPETMLELADGTGFTLPRETASELREYMCADNVADLADYLHRFDTTISILQTSAALERVAYELVGDASRDGLRYIEVRNAPHLNIHGGLTVDEVIEATLRGLARGERDFGTVARFITCSLRHWDPSRSLEAAEAAVRHMHAGVVGFDLAGPEALYSAADHAAAFAYAREHYLRTTCHAGEGAGPQSVREALFVCNATRIGHGVRSDEDADLLEFIRDAQVTLEMCPTSNAQTHAVSSYAEHPLKRYLESGVRVTINTDSRLISGVSLTDEYVRAVNELGLTISDLCRCVMNACEASFLPADERNRLVSDVRAELARDWGYQA